MTKNICVIGDSQTQLTPVYGVAPENMWAERTAARLRDLGANVQARAFGIGGQTTADFLVRCDVIQQREVPDLAIIYGGVNDVGNSIDTQGSVQAIIKCLKYGVRPPASGVGNSYATQNDLPANSPLGTRAVVLADTSATGGMAATQSSQKVRIAGNFSGAAQQAVWECRTPQAGPSGWGRVAVTGTPIFAGCCSRIIVVSTNYLNFTTGGDNVGAGTYHAGNQAIRALLQAAVAAEGAVYADLFALQAAAITSGETTQGSNSWHCSTDNQHHNAYGHDTVARAVVAAVVAQNGWLAALS